VNTGYPTDFKFYTKSSMMWLKSLFIKASIA